MLQDEADVLAKEVLKLKAKMVAVENTLHAILEDPNVRSETRERVYRTARSTFMRAQPTPEERVAGLEFIDSLPKS